VKYAWLVIGVLAAQFLATAIAFPQVDGDLHWQRWLGRAIVEHGAIPRALGTETFSAPGSPWTPQEWLFSLAASRATGAIGWAFFAGGIALCALVALALASWHAERRGASPRAIVVCLVPAGLGLFASFGVRVQVAAWPLLALFLLLLDLEGPLAFAAIAVAAVWSNVHASAMLAPILASAAAFGTFVDDRGPSPAFRRRAIIAVGSAIAICANPFGVGLPAYALSLFNSPLKGYIVEWDVTNLGHTSFVLGALPLLALACIVAVPQARRSVRDLVVLVAFSYLLLSAARNIALFGLVALPIVAPALTRAFAFFAPSPPPRNAREVRAERIAGIVMPAIGVMLALVVGIGLLRSGERTKDTLAARAIGSLDSLAGERRLFCADFAWCGLAVGKPNVRVFLDGRADPYPLTVWTDFDRIARLRPSWREALARYDVDTIVVSKDAPLDQALALGVPRAWRSTYADKNFRVWVRVRDQPSTSAAAPRVLRARNSRARAAYSAA